MSPLCGMYLLNCDRWAPICEMGTLLCSGEFLGVTNSDSGSQFYEAEV